MSFPLRALGLALMLCAIQSCSSPTTEEKGPVEMTFTVVDALLGPAVSLQDPPLTIRPPKGWDGMDSLRVAALEIPAGRTFHLKPRMVFMDSTSGCVLFVTSWTTDSTLAWAEAEARQKSELDQAGRGRQVRHDSFILAGQKCLQSLVQDSLRVNFKLLLDKGIQLDYIVPATSYATQAERIESSLGSLVFSNSSTKATGETP